MRTLNVAEAKKHLSDLLGSVAYGHEKVVIARRGKPLAMIVPVSEEDPRHLADARGWLEDDDPFFATMQAVEAGRAVDKPRDAELGE